MLLKYDLFRYGLVGIINTISGVGVMILMAWLGFQYTLYTSVGYLVAFSTSYILNCLFTFRAGHLSYQIFLMFVTLNGALLLLVEAAQGFLIEYAGVREFSGVAIGAVAYTLTGYLMNKHLVYRTG